MNIQLIIFISILYLLILFSIAFFVEKSNKNFSKWLNNPYIYTLSLAVYCSAWTFYGSVGRASTSGFSFLSIYLGPTIAAFLFVPLYKKFYKIKENTGFSSLADFISLRYGRNIWLGAIVTSLLIIGIVPYIALQLKSISESVVLLSNNATYKNIGNVELLQKNTSFYLTVLLCIFIMFYGFRSIDASEKRRGLITAIAFESIFKLIAFLIIGISIVVLTTNAIGNPAEHISNINKFKNFNFFSAANQFDWTATMFLSFFAFLFLPRQFQVGIVDNDNAKNFKKASWLFPLYLLLINIFVLPIALCGNAVFAGHEIKSDHYVIALPLHFNNTILSAIAYLGGFSAATSMVIVETIALTLMLVNNIILPITIWFNQRISSLQEKNYNTLVLNLRRAGVVFIILISFIYENYLYHANSLVNIGLTSFVAVAQFVPAVLGGLVWSKGNSKGIYAGLIAGFSIWFYLLILPTIFPNSFLYTNAGSFISPTNFFGMNGFNITSVAFVWSLFFNTILYLVVSVFTHTTIEERQQASIILRVMKDDEWYSNEYQFAKTKTAELKKLLQHFIGEERYQTTLISFKKNHNIDTETEFAQPKFLQYTQKVLSGILGVTSARLLLNSLHDNSSIHTSKEILSVLTEKQEIKQINKELVKKQDELTKATQLLQIANERLKKVDENKDEFLYTITHELRTPLTSIRALSEIVLDNPDLDDDERSKYINVIVKESERLTHLINQVLTLEKMESGIYEMEQDYNELANIISNALDVVEGIAQTNQCKIHTNIEYTTQQIFCDAQLIEQVISNLLSNAVKFANTTNPEVWVDVSYEKDFAKVVVTDNGDGIDPTIGDSLFNKFMQAKNRKKNKPQGSGLGLAICKRIVEMHQGKIYYEPKCKHLGAAFYIELPIKNNNYEL